MDEFYEEDGHPIKCYKCKSETIKTKIKDITAGTVCEVEYYCGECFNYLAYWAYGHFEHKD